MIVVTGGAGFIGSNIVAALNETGANDIVIVDTLGTGAKWRNIAKARVADIIPPDALPRWLAGRITLDAIVHMGANSATTATDADAIVHTNIRPSIDLLDWATEHGVPFVYASSAATYGDGAAGFEDDWTPGALDRLRPLNLYGWSKLMFDKVVAQRATRHLAMPPIWAGLKFFNVFGPNEGEKGPMASVVAKSFPVARRGEAVTLFKSHRDGIADGDQRRDFVYVKDVEKVVLWALSGRGENGIYNVGSGKARSFLDLTNALFAALKQPPRIDFVPMPETIRDKYQYFTEAPLARLREAGYTGPFRTLEDGVADYVQGYLDTADPYR